MLVTSKPAPAIFLSSNAFSKSISLMTGPLDKLKIYPLVFIFEKNSVTNKTSFTAIDLSKEKSFLDFTIYKERKVEINIETDKNWIISNPLEIKIKKKIEAIGKRHSSFKFIKFFGRH